uniref:Uncharacterized protein n=1 Tax=Arundo donax TaxID=35708 RepID=A0A0A8YQ01_ARUDO
MHIYMDLMTSRIKLLPAVFDRHRPAQPGCSAPSLLSSSLARIGGLYYIAGRVHVN